jgi:hypothetical protein
LDRSGISNHRILHSVDLLELPVNGVLKIFSSLTLKDLVFC